MRHVNISMRISTDAITPETLMASIRNKRFKFAATRVYAEGDTTVAHLDIKTSADRFETPLSHLTFSTNSYFTRLTRSLCAVLDSARSCKITHLMVESE